MHEKRVVIVTTLFLYAQQHDYSANAVNRKRVTSNNPLSLSFNSGITNKAINESVMNGLYKVQPNS